MNNESHQVRRQRTSFTGILSYILQRLSRAEKVIFAIATIVMVGAVIALLLQLQSLFLVTIPRHGGTLTEAVVGVPRFVNPVLAISDADRDLTALVYSGLLRVSESGELIPDLASSYAVSEDGKEYRFVIRDDATFHDGTKVTSYDVLFTIEKAKDPTIKSPRRAAWEGVSVEAPNDSEVVFRIGQSFAPFLDNLTLGIMPRHIWEGVSADEFPHTLLNVEAVGSGPFVVEDIVRSKLGIPESIELSSFDDFTLGEPYISDIVLRFYDSTAAAIDGLEAEEVDAVHGLDANEIASITRPGIINHRSTLPRVIGVFFNHAKSPALAERGVRLSLAKAVDRAEIIDRALGGFADPAYGPLTGITSSSTALESFTDAELTLDAAGWKKGADGIRRKTIDGKETELLVALSTSRVDEVVATANILKERWGRLGARVTVEALDADELSSTVIRPREFAALLFGYVVGRTPDLYPFWHSSQRNDPGLNVTGYANITVDGLLTKARGTNDKTALMGYHESFLKEIDADVPAVFLYSPHFTYAMADSVSGVALGPISVPSERFSNVYHWYLETDRVWSAFAPNDTR